MQIVSILAMAYCDTLFDLDLLSKLFQKSKIRPKNPWLKIRVERVNHNVSFCKSGKILISGLKSFNDAQVIAEATISQLHDCGLPVNIKSIKLVNAVCMTSIRLTQTLEKTISNLNSQNASYEPEQFPGLIYKDFGATFILFSTGKVIITGLKDVNNADIVLEKFLQIINR